MTNNFAALSAESDVDALAVVTCEEVFTAEVTCEGDALTVCASRITRAEVKLAGLPPRFARRVTVAAMADLHAAIHAECEPEREAARREYAAWLAL